MMHAGYADALSSVHEHRLILLYNIRAAGCIAPVWTAFVLMVPFRAPVIQLTQADMHNCALQKCLVKSCRHRLCTPLLPVMMLQ